MGTLYGTSPTLADAVKLVREFYADTPYDLVETSPGVWNPKHSVSGKVLTSVHVVKRRNRYRFETSGK
jgi:hypothetical protein